MKNNSNFFLFIFLSAAIWFGFQYFYVKPVEEHYKQQQPAVLPNDAALEETKKAPDPVTFRERAEILKDDPRISIETAELKGSINLKGARIDDLALVKYRETVKPDAPAVILLSPAGSATPFNAYYTDVSWLSSDVGITVPTAQTLWKTSDKVLSPNQPIHLTWDNGQGLTFERQISVDDHFMFTIVDQISNKGTAAVTLYPFGLVSRQGDFFIERRTIVDPALRSKYSASSYEGPLGVLGGTLSEFSYKKLRENGKKTAESVGGWLGVTDKYWLISLVPPQNEAISAEFNYQGNGATDPDHDRFQADFRGSAVTIAPGAMGEHTTLMFAGAKRLELLNAYSKKLNIALFNRAIDFGWFWFLTIPFLQLLNLLGHTLGSFGVAIIVFTVMIRLITLPLSLKMYHSSARMKELMPEMKRIQERFADDKLRQHQEQAELFKREKIKPLAGCAPLVIQLPIFFALYKALSVSIELRQAPFYGWISDMSVADPTSLFTLFGLIDWVPPIHVGAWPALMGLSMFVQQKLSPQPTDASQARMFMFMPVVLTYIMAQLPVGLVIYYTWSNLLSIAQQWFIMNKDAKKRGLKTISG